MVAPMMPPIVNGMPPPTPGAMGPQPPMPFGGAPPMPPMPGPMAPPEPQMSLDEDPITAFLADIEGLIDEQGEDAARDLLSALPPEMLDALYGLIDTDPRAAIVLGDILDPPEREPQYDPWYEPTKKPTPSEVLEIALDDQGQWQPIAHRIREDIAWYHGERPNVFKNFDSKRDDYWHSNAIRNDSDLKIVKVSTSEIAFEIPYVEQEMEEPTQKVENWLYDELAHASRSYARANYGHDLRHDVEWYREVTGWVFYETGLNFSGGNTRFIHRLHDPTTCFPEYDEYGLARITRIYGDTVRNIIACFDDDGDVERKLTREIRKQKDGKDRLLTMKDVVTVTYFIDRTWRIVLVDGVKVREDKHDYGFVPWAVGGSGLDEPAGLVANTNASQSTDGVWSISPRLEYKNISGFHHRKRTHAQKEAVNAKLFNMASRIDRTDWAVYQDEFAESEGTPQIKREGNSVTPLKKGHEELQPLLDVIPPSFFQPLQNAMDQEDATDRIPLSTYGVGESANRSGNATEGLAESGEDKFATNYQSAELFWSEVASLWMRMFRDWGHLLPNDKGEYGRVKVPYAKQGRWRAPDKPVSFDLTPEMLDHVGVNVVAQLTTLRMQNLGPLGNAASIWINNNAMSAREAMIMRGVRDPDAVFDEREYEQALLDPKVQEARRLKMLRERDPAAAQIYEQMIMMQNQQPPAPPGMPPGPPGAGQMAPNTSAMDLQALGMGQAGPTGRMPDPNAPPPPGAFPQPGGMNF